MTTIDKRDFEQTRLNRILGSLRHMANGEFCLPNANNGLDAKLDHLRRIIMEAALAKCNGNVCAAARLLGINRDAMRYRLGLTRKKQRPTTAS